MTSVNLEMVLEMIWCLNNIHILERGYFKMKIYRDSAAMISVCLLSLYSCFISFTYGCAVEQQVIINSLQG